jgi:tetratricopeptide (TPR) repeat protein
MLKATDTVAETARAEFARLDAAKDWPAARDLALSALALSDTRLDRFVWLCNLSVALWGLCRFRAAHSALNAAAQLLTHVSDPWLLGNYHNNRALAHLGRRRRKGVCAELAAAFVELDEAERQYEAAGARDKQAMVANNVGCLYVEAGEPDRAIPYLNRAAGIYDALGEAYDRQLGEVYKSLAEAYFARDAKRRALSPESDGA